MYIHDFKYIENLRRKVVYETGTTGGLWEGERKKGWKEDLRFHWILFCAFFNFVPYACYTTKNKIIHF